MNTNLDSDVRFLLFKFQKSVHINIPSLSPLRAIMDSVPEFESGCRTLWKIRNVVGALTLDEMHDIVSGVAPAEQFLSKTKETRLGY